MGCQIKDEVRLPWNATDHEFEPRGVPSEGEVRRVGWGPDGKCLCDKSRGIQTLDPSWCPCCDSNLLAGMPGWPG